ncbi:hypothetical protein EDC01DRAFT_301087 [Geopyxis carbonaria]|nr:hypothetical protein EDC01DRAFT_301087 [Geopyxis carbonaria]
MATWVGGSASSSDESPEASITIGIYKDFGRPFVKVFLMAMCTYQGFYWLWLKMELDEKKREKAAEISLLQDEVKKLTTEPSI